MPRVGNTEKSFPTSHHCQGSFRPFSQSFAFSSYFWKCYDVENRFDKGLDLITTQKYPQIDFVSSEFKVRKNGPKEGSKIVFNVKIFVLVVVLE